ncbi:hypothetical protein AA14337_0002 [Acetobacter malorum DSM 14337]|uniref:Uncharacterized protein n=1 Tax=Acetobacter malorum DSM 14337 TaxID=1307910 RepID=A0ABQ0PKU5_9PROT|nr:hypothetical protein [Acetobacter malorum]KXV08706.1 hypothetical protein AD930_03605 [Acetobacter malorum]GBQ74748.1 hypothetical protein AA14337_0002 [Acetobacter malorum DSM 14337]
MTEHKKSVRDKFREIVDNLSPRSNAVEQTLSCSLLKPGNHEIVTTWNGESRPLTYLVGDPELDEEVSVLIQDGSSFVSVRFDTESLTINQWSTIDKQNGLPPSEPHTISTAELIAPDGRERLDVFVETALASIN